MNIVERLRKTFGSESPSPRLWALDAQTDRLLRHIIFAEFGSKRNRYSHYPNQFLYERYQFPAWDFVHPKDFSSRLHLPFFRAAYGHRYLLFIPVVVPFDKDYGAGRHDMLGSLKSVE